MAVGELTQDFVTELPTQGIQESVWRRLTVVAAAGGLALVLAGCTSSGNETVAAATSVTAAPEVPAPPTSDVTETPAPTVTSPSSPTKYADCTPLKRGSPNLQCTAMAKGLFGLHGRTGKLIDAESAEVGDTFRLTRKPGAYTMECYTANVDFFPLPKDGTGKAYNVLSFNICDPNIKDKPADDCPEIDPGYEYTPVPGRSIDPGYEYTPKTGSEIDPGYEIDPRDNCVVLSFN